MPPIARWFIKTAMIYLVAALALGAAAGMGLRTPYLAAGPAWVHLLVLGWVTQLIFGVAYWLFPRYSKENPYGHARLAVAAYASLNAGLILRFLVEVPGAGAGVWPAVAALLQWAGVTLFAVYLWPRVKQK
jgi:heme/copper-type cytochrome/quinol oxidase subunit 1